MQIKPLKWQLYTKEDYPLRGISAEPSDLIWKYSILFLEVGKIQLSVFDNDYDYVEGYPKLCSSIKDAKEKATKHYHCSIAKFFM